MIIKTGQAVICKEQISMKKLSKKDQHTANIDKDFPELEKWLKRPQVFHESDKKRVYQNKRLFIDDKGNRIPKEIAVYKDLMAYGYLHKGEHFGGRVLVQLAIEKHMKKQFEREKQMIMSE